MVPLDLELPVALKERGRRCGRHDGEVDCCLYLMVFSHDDTEYHGILKLTNNSVQWGYTVKTFD